MDFWKDIDAEKSIWSQQWKKKPTYVEDPLQSSIRWGSKYTPQKLEMCCSFWIIFVKLQAQIIYPYHKFLSAKFKNPSWFHFCQFLCLNCPSGFIWMRKVGNAVPGAQAKSWLKGGTVFSTHPCASQGATWVSTSGRTGLTTLSSQLFSLRDFVG